MTAAHASTDPVVCPPHYWLIEASTTGKQRWRCRRCGSEHERDDHSAWAAYRPPARFPKPAAPASQ